MFNLLCPYIENMYYGNFGMRYLYSYNYIHYCYCLYDIRFYNAKNIYYYIYEKISNNQCIINQFFIKKLL